MDAIRGLALFGVLLVNLSGARREGKARTLFSMLFGFGFALMMGRLERRRAAFDAVYVRRLLVLAAADRNFRPSVRR